MNRREWLKTYLESRDDLKWIVQANVDVPQALKLTAQAMFVNDEHGLAVETVRQMIIDLERDGWVE